MKKTKIIILILIILVGLIFSGCVAEKKDNDNNEGEEEDTPDISFFADDDDKTVTIAAADPSNISWSDIEIIGNCDTSGLGVYVAAGEKITECYGDITLRWVPTNTLLAVFTFLEVEPTPLISAVKDDIDDTLTITAVNPAENLLWSDIEIFGNCNITGLGTYVIVGDIITECLGTITIRYNPTNTLIGTWDFN